MVNFKMIEKPFVLLFLLCLLPLGVSAQSIVKGIVTDPSGEPVIGATVKKIDVDGSKLGVVTDLDGKFSIDAAPGATLTITYVKHNEHGTGHPRQLPMWVWSLRP